MTNVESAYLDICFGKYCAESDSSVSSLLLTVEQEMKHRDEEAKRHK